MTRRKKIDVSYLADTPGDTSQPEQAIDIGKLKEDYLKIYYLQNKQKNNLLGSFSQDGKYVFDDKLLIDCLLSIPKHLDEKDNDVYYVSKKIGTFLLKFKIVFYMDPGFCKSEIYLIETEEKTEENVKHLTKLDENESVYQTLYKEEMFTYWNIYRDEDYVQKDEDERKILDYLKNQEKDYDFNRELTEILAQLYVLRLLAALDGCGEIGQKLKAEYKLLIEKIMLSDPSISQDYTRMKAILDEIIQRNNAMDEIMKNPEVAKAMQTFSAPITRIYNKENAPTREAIPVKKEQSAPEKKAQPSSASKPKSKPKEKSGGEKDKGGGDKKKKEDKKKEEHKGAPIIKPQIQKPTPVPKKPQESRKRTRPEMMFGMRLNPRSGSGATAAEFNATVGAESLPLDIIEGIESVESETQDLVWESEIVPISRDDELEMEQETVESEATELNSDSRDDITPEVGQWTEESAEAKLGSDSSDALLGQITQEIERESQERTL